MISPAPEILRIAGEALYGERWQSRLARDLGMSDRNLRFMLAGTHGGAFELPERVAALLGERAERLLAAASRIDELTRTARDRGR